MLARIVAILVAGMAVNIYIPVAPSLLGALVDYQGLSTDVAGRLIAANFWGATVATVLVVFVVHRPGWNLRYMMLTCLMLVVLTSGASVWLAGNVEALAVVRFLNGVGAGAGFTVGAVALIGTPRVERSYAVFYGSPFVISGAGLAFLPEVYQATGIEGAFYGMGALNLVCIALLPFYPKSVTERPEEIPHASGLVEKSVIPLVAFILGALFLHYVFNSGIWTYFERLGVAYGMSPETAGRILGPSMSAAIVGMVAASLLGDRFGYLPPIYVGTALIALCTLSLLGSASPLVFGLGTGLFNASITFVTPYFIALLAGLIPSGFGVSTANIATLAGFSTGPFLVSFLVAGDRFQPTILLTATGFVIVIALVVIFARALRENSQGRQRIGALCGLPEWRDHPK